jgi:hypothetical protein
MDQWRPTLGLITSQMWLKHLVPALSAGTDMGAAVRKWQPVLWILVGGVGGVEITMTFQILQLVLGPAVVEAWKLVGGVVARACR